MPIRFLNDSIEPEVPAPLNKSIKEKLEKELCAVHVNDLARSFLAGRLLELTPSLSLVDVGTMMAENDHCYVKELMNSEQLTKVDDQKYKAWCDMPVQLQMLIVSPFVLVQQVHARTPEKG